MQRARRVGTRIQVRVRAASDLVRAAADGRRMRAEFDDVRHFCLFIGYPRSGHSLVGSFLDAHPDVVLSHELDVMRYVRTGRVWRNQLFALILRKDRAFTAEGRRWTYGFDYSVPGQWQGRHRDLRVIGDKKGGATTQWLAKEPDLLTSLRTIVGVDMRLVHVVRDPLDNIASMHRRGTGSLRECADMYFSMCATNDAIRHRGDVLVRDVMHEDLVSDPLTVLTDLCRFLDVQPDPAHLQACASVLYTAPHRSRDAVAWPEGLQEDVGRSIEAFDFLHRYGSDR